MFGQEINRLLRQVASAQVYGKGPRHLIEDHISRSHKGSWVWGHRYHERHAKRRLGDLVAQRQQIAIPVRFANFLPNFLEGARGRGEGAYRE